MSLNSFLSACALMAASLFISSCKNAGNSQATATDPIDSARITSVRFIADSAFATIKAQCNFGPRVPNSEAHRRCGDYIAARFKALGLEVTEQKVSLTAWDGNVLQTRNIIAAYRPELTDRIIICTHWESRPWADADPDSTRHREPVMAANDGASGVGVNEHKRPLQTADSRVESIARLYAGEPRVKVVAYSDLTIDLARREGADFILRGLRSVKDFEYERDIAVMNKALSGVETVLLFTDPQYSAVSSSVVRELLAFGKDVSEFLPH